MHRWRRVRSNAEFSSPKPSFKPPPSLRMCLVLCLGGANRFSFGFLSHTAPGDLDQVEWEFVDYFYPRGTSVVTWGAHEERTGSRALWFNKIWWARRISFLGEYSMMVCSAQAYLIIQTHKEVSRTDPPHPIPTTKHILRACAHRHSLIKDHVFPLEWANLSSKPSLLLTLDPLMSPF